MELERPPQGATTPKGTWQYEIGKSAACITLAKILRQQNNPKLSRQVRSSINDWSEFLNSIGPCLPHTGGNNERKHDINLFRILHKHLDEIVARDSDWPKEVQSYYNNVMRQRLRDWARERRAIKGRKQ